MMPPPAARGFEGQDFGKQAQKHSCEGGFLNARSEAGALDFFLEVPG